MEDGRLGRRVVLADPQASFAAREHLMHPLARHPGRRDRGPRRFARIVPDTILEHFQRIADAGDEQPVPTAGNRRPTGSLIAADVEGRRVRKPLPQPVGDTRDGVAGVALLVDRVDGQRVARLRSGRRVHPHQHLRRPRLDTQPRSRGQAGDRCGLFSSEAGTLAVRGWTRASTESGEAPGWQGATKGA